MKELRLCINPLRKLTCAILEGRVVTELWLLFFLGKISLFYKFQVIFSNWFKDIWGCTLDKWQEFGLSCNPNVNNIWDEGGSKLH